MELQSLTHLQLKNMNLLAVQSWMKSRRVHLIASWRLQSFHLNKSKYDRSLSLARYNCHAVHLHWLSWQRYYQKRVFDQLVMFNILHMWLTQGLRKWRARYHYSVDFVSKTDMVGFQRYACRKQRQGLSQWRQLFFEKVQACYEFRHRTAQLIHFRMHQTFGCWRSGAHLALKATTAQAATDLLERQQLLTSSWHAWVGNYLEKSALRVQLNEAGQIWQRGHWTAALREWHCQIVINNKVKLHVLESTKRKCVSMMQDALVLWQMMSCWKLKVHFTQARTAQRLRLQHRHMRHMLEFCRRGTWSNERLARAVVRVSETRGRFALRSWQWLCKWHRTAREIAARKVLRGGCAALLEWQGLAHGWNKASRAFERSVQNQIRWSKELGISRWRSFRELRAAWQTRLLVANYQWRMRNLHRFFHELLRKQSAAVATACASHCATMYRCANAFQIWCLFAARSNKAQVIVSEGWAPSLPPSPKRPSLGNYSVTWEDPEYPEYNEQNNVDAIVD